MCGKASTSTLALTAVKVNAQQLLASEVVKVILELEAELTLKFSLFGSVLLAHLLILAQIPHSVTPPRHVAQWISAMFLAIMAANYIITHTISNNLPRNDFI